MIFEFSAGGVIVRGSGDKLRILLIQTENLKKEIVWTFPKGHIEKDESSESAALREVKEETGYICKITKALKTAGYWFRNGKKLTKKAVKWFLMKPVKKIGKPDKEILKTRWCKFEEARKLLSYESDKKMTEQLINGN